MEMLTITITQFPGYIRAAILHTETRNLRVFQHSTLPLLMIDVTAYLANDTWKTELANEESPRFGRRVAAK